MRRQIPPTLPVIACLLLAGCAATSESGRSRMVAPGEIGAVYSEVEVQARMALIPNAMCEPDCRAVDAFREQVWRLAQRLDVAARQFGKERKHDVPLFNISVPLKDEIGTLSSSAGNILIFDGLRPLAMSEPLLAFLIAREMGHIIGRHHEENTATGLAVSLAIALVFPVAGLIQGAQAAYAASSVPVTLASSVASFAGSRVVRSIYKLDQRREADGFALQILLRAGWTPFDVAAALHAAEVQIGEDGWMGELRDSKHWLATVAVGPIEPTATELAAVELPPPVIEPAQVVPRVDDFPPTRTSPPPLTQKAEVRPVVSATKSKKLYSRGSLPSRSRILTAKQKSGAAAKRTAARPQRANRPVR